MNGIKVTRRTLVRGAAWAVPATVVTTAAPSFAASGKPNPSACAAVSTVPTRKREPNGWEGPSVRLTLSTPVRTPINGALFSLAVPPSLTIANVGPTAVEQGSVVELSAWKLDTHGIVDKNAPTVLTSEAVATAPSTPEVQYLASSEVSANLSRFTLACSLAPYQQFSVDLTWRLAEWVLAGNLASVQFLARIVTNADPLQYTEFQSPEVLGGTTV